MGWFNRSKREDDTPYYTYYGDKNPTLPNQIATLLADPRFVGIERRGVDTYRVTIRVWQGVSRQNLSHTDKLEKIMHWTGVTLERDKHAIKK